MFDMGLFRKRHPPVGSRPGTLVVDRESPKPRLTEYRYSERDLSEREISNGSEVELPGAGSSVLWLDVQGLGDEQVIRGVAERFEIHPLVVEDVVNVPQRPKTETYAAHQLVILRAVARRGESVDVEQVSVLIGRRYVLTFQERHSDRLAPVVQRLRDGLGPMRRSGPDYLAYAIVDLVVDAYYPLLEELGEEIEELEVDVTSLATGAHTPDRLRVIRRALVHLRRAVAPLREAMRTLSREPTPFVGEEVRLYLRDVYDHCAQGVDVVETYRDIATGALNTHLSVIGQRTNEIMKVLTIMASIFIPLTFLAGIYGMNFDVMPELRVAWAYPLVLGTMVFTALGMLLYFRRRGWIGEGRRRRGRS